jgi:hypothetical protein
VVISECGHSPHRLQEKLERYAATAKRFSSTGIRLTQRSA